MDIHFGFTFTLYLTTFAITVMETKTSLVIILFHSFISDCTFTPTFADEILSATCSKTAPLYWTKAQLNQNMLLSLPIYFSWL